MLVILTVLGFLTYHNIMIIVFLVSVSNSVNVQPDLLCGQNRFPQHLDSPTTVDVASSAVASIGILEDQAGNPNGVVTSEDFQGTGENLGQVNKHNSISVLLYNYSNNSIYVFFLTYC